MDASRIVKSPNKYAFLALECLLQYIHTHKHEAMFYPAKPIRPDQTIKHILSKIQSQTISHHVLFILLTLPSEMSFLTDGLCGQM